MINLKYVVLVLSILCSLNIASAQKNKKKDKSSAPVIELNNRLDSVSYGVGLNISLNLKESFSELNLDALIFGLSDGINNDSTFIKDEVIKLVVMKYFKDKTDSINNIKFKEHEKIALAGVKFLEENKSKEGVQVTESGLQYIVLKEGTGKSPSATSSVTVHYEGTTPEGVIFDSSVNRGKPATFGLNQVIKGWTEGLQLMKEGAKYKFFIPQQLAYGANPPQKGEGPIKKFMPLVFEVELISVND